MAEIIPTDPAAFRIVYDGQLLDAQAGDSVAHVAIRNRQAPAFGGPLCLSGDCGNCVATVNGVSWTRTCQTGAKPGMVVSRHPNGAAPSLFSGPASVTQAASEYAHLDAVVVGGGRSGTAAAHALRAAGKAVTVFDTKDGHEVVALYAGPTLIVRTPETMLHVHAHEVVLATGSSELLPVVPGNTAHGIFTVSAAESLRSAGIDLGRVVTVGRDIASVESHGGRLVSVATDQGTVEADSVIVDLGRAPRDVLVRMQTVDGVRSVGSATQSFPLPPAPQAGMACACSKITVEDVQGVWDRGFRETELMKRSALFGTGTCQGAACLPHLQAFIAARSTESSDAEPFTARAAARQVTMSEAAAGYFPDAWKRTPLHYEHLALGANMDRFGGWWRPWNYGDHVAEYWAVREAVSIGDVSTLGKLIVSGPDSIEFLERIYPTTIADIKPGRSRYVLILNERGHLFDDGMVLREEDRVEADGTVIPWFTLSFTSGGATNAEAWLRDWAETWNLDVHIMDRTSSLAAINVTGPLGRELLIRSGVASDDVPKFLQHRRLTVAGVPCHAMRLSFTGEASWELHHPWNRSVELWRALMAVGRDLGIKPHGLQALFGLRLEKGHVIVGMDTELDTTPRRISHEWAVKMQKPFFLGQEALARTAPIVDHRKLIGLTMEGPVPTEGCPMFAADGTTIIGHVTTAFASPLLGKSVALAMLKRDWDPGGGIPQTYVVEGRLATLAEPPFYDPEGSRARA
jgi:glycine cleavage system aminomethyltransferase T